MRERIARNTLYLTIASIGQKSIAFVYFLFLARIMMPEATGEYFLALSIVTIFSVVAEFGVTSVTIREVAKNPSNAQKLSRYAIGLKIPLAILAVISSITAGYLLGYNSTLRSLILLATIVLWIDTFHVFFYGILRGFQKIEFEAVGVFMGMMTTALFGGAILFFHPSLHLLILALILGSLVNLFISSWNVSKQLGWSVFLPKWSKEHSCKLIRTAVPFALAAIFVKVYSYIDSIFISKFLDIASVGLYAIAYKFTYAFQFLPLAFIAALYPAISAVIEKKGSELNTIFLKSIWYMAILSAPIVLGIYTIAPELVHLAGEEYANAASVLRVLVFVLIPIFLDFPIGSLLNAANKQSIKTSIMGITMCLNIVFNLILIPTIGILGAAYAALISFWFMFCAGLYFVPKILPNFSLPKLIKIVGPIYASGGIMFFIIMFLKPFTGWIAVIPIGAILYLGALLFFGSMKLSDLRHIKSV